MSSQEICVSCNAMQIALYPSLMVRMTEHIYVSLAHKEV